MATTDIGKIFEERFKKDWSRAFPKPQGWIFRLKDQLSGFKEASQNPCDFLCFTKNKLFMVECKAHKKASIPFTAIPQYERLLNYRGYNDVYPGVVIYFYEKDLIMWVGIDDMKKMVDNGEKSIGLRMLEDPLYNIVIIPAIKKRVYLEADYSCLPDIMNNLEDTNDK